MDYVKMWSSDESRQEHRFYDVSPTDMRWLDIFEFDTSGFANPHARNVVKVRVTSKGIPITAATAKYACLVYVLRDRLQDFVHPFAGFTDDIANGWNIQLAGVNGRDINALLKMWEIVSEEGLKGQTE